MAAYGQYDWRARPARASFSSLALLAVFVAAAALMLAILIWRPGLGSDNTGTAPVAEAGAATVEAGTLAPPDGSPVGQVTQAAEAEAGADGSGQ